MLARYEPIAPEGSLEWLAQPLPKTLRVNTLKADARSAQGLLAEDGVRCAPAPWHPDAFIVESTVLSQTRVSGPASKGSHALGNTRAHFLGHIYVQDLASLLPVMALEPHLKQLDAGNPASGPSPVLDACAAPGSKTTQLAAALDNRGAVVANDPSYQRLKALKSNLERLGVANTVITNLDVRRFPQQEFLSILLDVPCSSEGTLRKRVFSTRESHPPARGNLAALQKQVLRRAFALLAPGGALVYSTCTFAPEENELVIASLLAAEPAARVEPFQLEGVPLAPGITEWQGHELPKEVGKARRLWPGPQWGGFFLAKVRKEA